MKRITALFLTFIFLFACVSCRKESENQVQTSENTTVSTVLTSDTTDTSSANAAEPSESEKAVIATQTTSKPQTGVKNTVKSTVSTVISAVKTTAAPKKRPQRTTVRTPLPTSPSTTAALSTLATTATIASTSAKTTTTRRTETSPADLPAVNPTPTEPQKLRCTISIDCSTILNNKDKLKNGKELFVPADGKILKTVTVEFEQGETVFDILKRVCANNHCSGNCQFCQSSGIQLEYSYSGGYGNYYIEGIHQIYEKDCGSKSGWMFKVNGVFPNVGCSSYTVKNGDKIEWLYTCDLGEDIGAEV